MTNQTVLLAVSHPAPVCDALARWGYATLATSDGTEALAMLRANPCLRVLVADVDAGGLPLAREARAIRSDLGIVYTASAPHRIAENTKVPGAPILRTPYGGHQLAGLIAGLGRRVLDDPLAA